ncbi:MAG: UvrD-helicase domain-containing protein [Clostridia bacterium]|nr:UvrD-helicase domain-containing protein [Clostridia bacterium]
MSNKWTDDQKMAIESKSKTIMVSAAAGTGKTSAMIERAVRLIVDEKVPIERIMMLSYNNKSGNELKTKLRKALIERAKSTADVSIQDWIRAQLDSFSRADIGTIHGYCFDIVKEFFYKVGQSPDLVVIDENDSNELKAKAMKEAFKEYEVTSNIIELIDKLSLRKDDKFIGIVEKLYDYMVVQEEREKWLNNAYAIYDTSADFEDSPIARYIVEYFNDVCGKIMKIASSQVERIKKGDVRCEKYAEKLIPYLDNFDELVSVRDLFNAYKDFAAKGRPSDHHARINIDADLFNEMKTTYDAFKDNVIPQMKELFDSSTSYEELIDTRNKAAEQVKALIDATLIFQRKYDELKTEEGVVDFQDLLRYTWIILNDKEDDEEVGKICKDIRSRHDYVFLDEAQDVNYLQNAVIRSIAEGANFYVVGDVKQSIYRFQLAEPNIFLNSFNEISGKGEGISFRANFRSETDILEFVNRAFSILMTKDFGKIAYGDESAGHKFNFTPKECRNDIPAVSLLFSNGLKLEKNDAESEEEENKPEEPSGEEQEAGAKPDKVYDMFAASTDNKAKDDAYAEAGLIKAYIDEAVGKMAYVPEDGEIHHRKLEHKDIVILYRARSQANKTLEALSAAGVPLNLGKFEGEIGQDELDMVMDYLSIIDNVYDDYALIASLHSYVGGMTNEELADVRRKYPHEKTFAEACLLYAKSNNEYADKYKQFFDDVERFRKLSAYTEVSEFVKIVMEESGFATYIASGLGGLQKIAAINGYVYGVKGKQWANDLHSFVVHYRENEKPKLKGASSRADGVSFYTCHETKGLDYPVVILAGLYGDKRGDGKNILVDREFGAAMDYYDPTDQSIHTPFDVNATVLKKKNDEKEDELRLLYVALTRAKCALAIVCDESKPCPALPEFGKKFGDWINYCLANYPDTFKEYKHYLTPYQFNFNDDADNDKNKTKKGTCGDDKSKEEEQAKNEKIAKIHEEVEKVLRAEYPHRDATKLHSKYSVSELNSEEKIPAPKLFVEEEDRAKKGTNYHLVMQYVDLFAETVEDVKKSIASLVEDEILTEEQAREIKPEEILAFLNTSIGVEAKNVETLREKRFIYRKKAKELNAYGSSDIGDEETLIQGVIDMLIIGEKVILVDFKKSDSTDEVLRDRYKEQLDLYAEAVEKGLSRKVDEKYLYVFGRNKLVKM